MPGESLGSVFNRVRPVRQHVRLLAAAIATLGYFAIPAPAQESGKVIVPLQINRPYQQPFRVAWLEFDKGARDSSPDRAKAGAVRFGTLPGGLRVAVEAAAAPPDAYRVKVDTDGDNDLADETPLLMAPDSSVTVNVTRQRAKGERATLPYTLSYSRRADGRQVEETFYWQPDYVAEGKLKLGVCEASVKVLDADGDGVFDRRDFKLATTIHLDDGKAGEVVNLNDPRVIRHGDGRIEIPDELRRSARRKWLRGEEVIEFCGGHYTVDTLDPDGSALVLARTEQRVPRVGESLPALVLTTLDGQTIDMKGLKGAVTLLDFWASWCQPCVEKFPAVKRIAASHKGNLKVIAINVDESARLPTARQVIKEYELTWPHVATGRGEGDPVWKVFGSMSNNGLAIPLYVLVDADGIIRYAGNGGENLSELRAKVEEWGPRPPTRVK